MKTAWLRILPAVVLLAASCRGKSETKPAAATAPAAEPKASTAGLVLDKALVDGHLVEISHSAWDGGRSADLFDNDPATLARTENANPVILEFRLPEARPLKGISVTMGGRDFDVTATVRPVTGAAKTYTKTFKNMPADPTLEIPFDTGDAKIASLRVEIKDLLGSDGHIHVRTVKLL